MKKKIILAAFVMAATTISAQNYQISNSDFEEEWKGANEPGNGWNSFPSAVGALSGFSGASACNTIKTKGYKSETAVLLSSINLFLAKANGNLTTGLINMGSATPANSSNYNSTVRSKENGYSEFAGYPDSITVYAKFKPNASGYNAQGTFIIHGDIDFKDPYETEDNVEDYQLAKGILPISSAADWTRFSVPMTYSKDKLDGKRYILASFTTNPTPGGSEKDTLVIDDVKFIYNSKLSSLSVGGVSVADFSKDVFSYDLSTSEYKANTIEAVSDAKAATVEVAYNESTSIATVTVKGNDWSETNKNQNVYTLKFGKNTGIGAVSSESGAANIYTISGKTVKGSADALSNGTYIVNGKKILK